MTAEEFLQIDDIDELYSWCCENGYDGYFDNYIYYDHLSECIMEDLREAVARWDWDDIRSALNDIDTSYSWYTYEGLLQYSGIGYWETRDLRDEIYSQLLDDDFFEEEEEEEEEDQPFHDTPEPVPSEPEIDAVDIDGLSEMNRMVWGAILDARPPEPKHPQPEKPRRVTPASTPIAETPEFQTLDLSELCF